jgi:hypothetical protein
MLKTIAMPAFVLAAISFPASAQLIVGNDQTTPTIYNIDPTTGIATPIHSGATADVWGMAYDSATNTLYWNSGVQLYSSPLGPALSPTLMGNITYQAASIAPVSLSFHNGKLYTTRNLSPEAVYEINLATLDCTLIYQYPAGFDFGGLDHDGSTGVLYGLTDTATAPDVRGLYSIDLVAMTHTFLAPYPAGETDIDGLAVANGLAYFVSDGPNTTQASFYVIDVATGMQVATIPSPFTGSGTFSAATWAGNAPPQSTAYCFGDGTGTACPCANSGASGNGCASSVNPSGANLTTSGSPSIGADTLVLLGSGMPDSSALYFQGTTQSGGGLGVPFGDGLRCVAGTIVRLKTVTNVGGSSQYPQAGDPSVSVKGMILAPGIRTYQVWYRNAAAFCTASTFNLTNGVEVSWQP